MSDTPGTVQRVVRKLRSRFVADVGTLLVGGGIAQAITLIATPVITRLYTPEDFGAASFFLAIVAVVSPLATLRYEQAIPLPKDDRKADLISLVGLRVSLLVTALCTAVVVVWGAVAEWPEALQAVGGWIYVLPPMVLLTALGLVAALRRTRQRDFGAISTANVAASSSMSLGRIVFGLLGGSSAGALLAGTLLGEAARLVGLTDRACLRVAREGAGGSPLGRVAHEYADFPRNSAPTGLLNRFSGSMPVLMLTALFGPATAGLFALAARVLRNPLEMFRQSVRRVLLQRGAVMRHEGKPFGNAYLQVAGALLAISVPPLAALALFGERLFSLAFGEKWAAAGEMASLLVPWLVTVLPMSAANVAFYVCRALGLWLLLQVIITSAGLSVFLYARWAGWEPLQTVATFAWVVLPINIVIIVIGWFLARSTPDAGVGDGGDRLPEGDGL